MNIIDCGKVRNEILEMAKFEVADIYNKTNTKLKLVVIQVDGDNASDVYIRNKLKTCEQVGVECEHIKLPNDSDVLKVANTIKEYSLKEDVTGVMLQLPLPKHLKPHEQQLLDLIPWYKDVDGLSTESVGRLWTNQPCIVPATAKGVMRLLPQDLSGMDVCVVGRSNLVGKPLVKLLEERNATVTLCHSKTDEMDRYTIEADYIICAIGKPKYIGDYYANLNYMQTWIDVGINRDKDGKLCGDIDIDDFRYNEHVNITPVPSGVGLLTTAQLVLNVIEAYNLQTQYI